LKTPVEKAGLRKADYKAAPRATASRELRVRSVCSFLKVAQVVSRMMGVLVASPNNSTKWICS